MPTRMIREGYLDSEAYASVDDLAKLVWHHMLSVADDFGCLSLAPSFVRRRLFYNYPSDATVSRVLSQLADADLIRIYTHDDSRYAFIPRFRQTLKTLKSRCPAPPPELLRGDQDAIDKFEAIASGEQMPFGTKWQALRLMVLARDDNTCVRCGAADDLHAHHLTPKSRGGKSSLENLTTLCGNCNSWARNNIDRCQTIKDLVVKKGTGQVPAGTFTDIPQHLEEKRREVEEKKKTLASRDESRSADESPVIERLPLNDGTYLEIQQSIVDELSPAYPAVDVPATLREIKAWCVTNPKNRKTRSGALRFVNAWLKREQDRAPVR